MIRNQRGELIMAIADVENGLDNLCREGKGTEAIEQYYC